MPTQASPEKFSAMFVQSLNFALRLVEVWTATISNRTQTILVKRVINYYKCYHPVVQGTLKSENIWT